MHGSESACVKSSDMELGIEFWKENILWDCGVVVVKSCEKTLLSHIGLETRKPPVLRKDGVSQLGHFAESKKISSLEATTLRSTGNIQVIVHEKRVSIAEKMRPKFMLKSCCSIFIPVLLNIVMKENPFSKLCTE